MEVATTIRELTALAASGLVAPALCRTSHTRRYESAYYTGNLSLNVVTIPRTGHNIGLSTTAQQRRPRWSGRCQRSFPARSQAM